MTGTHAISNHANRMASTAAPAVGGGDRRELRLAFRWFAAIIAVRQPVSGRGTEDGGVNPAPTGEPKLDARFHHSQSVNDGTPEIDRTGFRKIFGGAGDVAHRKTK